ncbi:unnamed protein product [Rotaria sordida]|uniref:Uncharacterized protein n=1 Tax=Rotaria sordida TaxID=392033 RepID=A0A813RDU8_9BILA|nr:unnamed protein product [Rotaria sordida]
MPSDVPDRTAGGCRRPGKSCTWMYNDACLDGERCATTTVQDSLSDQFTENVVAELNNTYGLKPFVVIGKWSRKKVDFNREINQATLNYPESINAYQSYHMNLENAINQIKQQYGKGLLIDVHGQGVGNFTMVGYLLDSDLLNKNDLQTTLGTITSIEQICSLSNRTECIRGKTSFGTILERNELGIAYPSMAHPKPGNGTFFEGGYITRNYISKINAIQTELPYSMRAGTYKRMNAIKYARTLIDYMTVNNILLKKQQRHQFYNYELSNKENNLLQSMTNTNEQVITCIEDLSNEIFYNIFDYLNGCHLYESFVNLNTRFQNLLIKSFLPLKINIDSKHEIIIEHLCKNIINRNKSRIISLHLSTTIASKQFLKLVTINSLFNRLQSLVINGIVEHKLQLLLKQLTCLPRLCSLNIFVIGQLESFNTIYKLIFRLPFLKYNTLSYGPWRAPITLPVARNEQFNYIEYLNIGIIITLVEVITILSYTPKLRRLTCQQLYGCSQYISTRDIIKLPYLTHINFDQCRLRFSEFELFIKKINSQLRVLHFTTFDNISFLDANRWQRLIVQYLPHLYKFEFEYDEKISNTFQLGPHHQQINQFTSLFWLQRQWYLHLQTDASPFSNNRITYSIHSYRKKWYHLCQHMKSDAHYQQDNSVDMTLQNIQNHVIPSSQRVELIATNHCDFEQYQSFIENIKSLFQLVQITHLNIDLCYSSIDLFIDFIYNLPYLDSLSMSCLPISELNISSTTRSKLQLISQNNRITKVNLEKLIEINQIQFIINLCSRMEFLQIGCTNDMDFELFIRFILMNYRAKSLHCIYLLCLHFPTADKKTIKKIRNMISSETLLNYYSINRILDKIYLHWK